MGPVIQGRAAATISLRGNAPRTWRLIGLDFISGERVLPMDLIAPHLAALDALPRFGFKVFLNRLLLDAARPVAVVRWPGWPARPRRPSVACWRACGRTRRL